MSKFDAATAVEAMEFDFTKYGGREGIIPEPTTGQMNDFMVGMRRLIAEYRQVQGNTEQVDMDAVEKMDADELGKAMDTMDDNMRLAQEFNTKSVALTAEFCSGSPSKDELTALPMRVMRMFSKWLMQEINPKDEEAPEATTPAPTRPTPTDRRRATKGSRKGAQ